MLGNAIFNVFQTVFGPFGTCESLGSSLVKMSQAFHDPTITSICFNFLSFHWKVNTFKTPEMCLYLDSDFWAGWFTIIFAGSFHYIKPVSCWILFCENVAGVPPPFKQFPSCVAKVNTIKTPEMPLLFQLRRLRRMSRNSFCWIFFIF